LVVEDIGTMREGTYRSSKRLREKVLISIPTIDKMGNSGNKSSPHPKCKATRRNYKEWEDEEMESDVKTDKIKEAIPLPLNVLDTFENVTPDSSKSKNNEHDMVTSMVKMAILDSHNQVEIL
jgi:hypothetical protein